LSVVGPERVGDVLSGGHRLRFRVRGDGPPLLMIHGLGASFELWDPLDSKLRGFQRVAVDPPGSGRSSTPHLYLSIRGYARAMAEVLDDLELDTVDVLGLSLGGMIAQELAYRHPSRVRRLVLASTTCGWGGAFGDPRAMAVLATPARYYSRRHFHQVAPILSGPQIKNDRELYEEQLAIRQRIKPSLLGYFVQLTAAWTWTSLPWLSRLDLPLLAISGSDDPIVPLKNSQQIVDKVPGARLAVVPGGGHLCIIESAAHVAGIITEFLESP
jgi:pimeloyl-ACP methyl ester carboxylesterase